MKYIFSIFIALIFSSILPTTLLQNEIVETSITLAPPPIEQKILKYMTAEEKVGQLFMFGINGTTLTPETKQFLTDHHIGNVLLYSKNVVSEEQVKSLTESLQTTNRIPLFISIDQEGGIVARLKWNNTLTIAQENIKTSEQAYTIAKDRGEMLKKIGINMNLAPVVEYITNKNSFMYYRVFRGSLEEVIQKGISSVQGYKQAEIVAVLKHYPGHSDTSPDSHFSLPVVNISNDQWSEYVKPFSRILEQIPVDGIMVGHVEYPNIDTNPSTISSKIISKRLIQELGYSGLIISDDMEMGALQEIDTDINLAKRALMAGNDILIYSTASDTGSSVQKQIYDYILQEVINKNLDIDEKVLKILRMKIQYGILQPDLNFFE
jgi:beta-N-acetylhexosaminidase